MSQVPMEPAILIFVLDSILKFHRPMHYVLVLNSHKKCFPIYNQGCIGTKVWAGVA